MAQENPTQTYIVNEENHRLSFGAPASDWLEALPTGNGQLGAMVFGDPISERIQITEESIWAGPPVPETPSTAKEGIEEARKLLFEGRFKEAQDLVEKDVLSPAHAPRSQQSLGDILIHFHGRRVRNVLFAMAVGPDPRLQLENLQPYHRELNLRNGIVKSAWNWDGHEESGEVFCSYPDKVVVARYRSTAPQALSCRISLKRESGAKVEALGQNGLALRGIASHRGKQVGVSFGTVLKVEVKGGECISDTDGLEVWGADEILLVLAASSNYNRQSPLEPLQYDLIEHSSQRVEAALKLGYNELEARHLKDHRTLYEHTELNLGSSPYSDLHLDERMNKIAKGEKDPSLEALFFHFGRYLLIGSSRPGTLPANLQGVWNHELAAPWNADYHTNINLQMNYWAAESTGLGDCHDAFFDFMESLLPSAQASARAIGCRGAYVGVSTDVWKYTPFYGDARFGMWVMGLAWCSRHFMERYWHSQDITFLKERTWPMLKECALFFVDWLTEDPKSGKLVSGPSTSPENRFFSPEGEEVSLSMGCSMDQLIIWECFSNTLETAKILGERPDWIHEVAESKDKLALPSIGSDGRMMEWIEEYPEVEPGHRHLSHAYGLHPGLLFDQETHPDEHAAVAKTIQTRLEQTKGLVGWSNVWICHFYARLGQPEKALQKLLALRTEVTPNLFGKGGPVFQIDHNLGLPSAIIEMLVQSHRGRIELLPSLPDSWPKGSITGLKVRGGFELDLSWESGQLSSVSLRSPVDSEVVVVFGSKQLSCKIKNGTTKKLIWKNNSITEIP